MNKVLTVFFMGYSGSGKDTQADLLRQFLEKRDDAKLSFLSWVVKRVTRRKAVFLVSTGDILRAAVKSGTYAGQQIDQKVMLAGNAAPSFMATWAWAEGIMKGLRNGQHVIFPSSPRSVQEARDLIDFAKFFDLEPHPVFIDVTRDEAFRRLKARGRTDDVDDAIHHRLDYFSKQVEPAIRFYQSQPVGIVIINGNPQEPLAIQEEIQKKLKLA